MCSTYTLTVFENCNKSNESVKIIAASDHFLCDRMAIGNHKVGTWVNTMDTLFLKEYIDPELSKTSSISQSI